MFFVEYRSDTKSEHCRKKQIRLREDKDEKKLASHCGVVCVEIWQLY